MWQGTAWRGEDWRGEAQYGLVVLQLQTATRRTSVLSAALYGSGQGTVGKAKAGLSLDWRGKAIAADGSTEHFGVPCCSLWRVDLAGLGRIRSGMAVSGGVWR